MLFIAKEVDFQSQIDRACSAQSPEMLPKTDIDVAKIEAARQRIEKHKSQQ